MSSHRDALNATWSLDAAAVAPAPAPGKATRTQRLARAAAPSPSPSVAPATTAIQRAQLEHDLAGAVGFFGGPAPTVDSSIARMSDDAIAGHAAHGVSGAGQALPHLDTIQRAFGPHDVGGVRAHVGGAAAEASDSIGAHGYATGNDVAFAREPDLFLAAHEAAHVVQQRQGVQLSGAVGQDGDSYERHADQVAAAVVRGDSAAALLGDPGEGGTRAVQRTPAPAATPEPETDPDLDPSYDPAIGTDAEQAAARMEFADAVNHWEDTSTAVLRAHRDWVLDNYGAFLEQTAPHASVSWNKGLWTTFAEGWWGNTWTDAPDAALTMAGKGAAESANNYMKGLVAKKATDFAINGAKSQVAKAFGAKGVAMVAGTLVGGVVGLAVASAAATLVEMAVDAILDSQSAERLAAAASASAAVAQTRATFKDKLTASDRSTGMITSNARTLREVTALALNGVGEIQGECDALRAKADQVKAAAATRAGDTSLFKALMRDWVIKNAEDIDKPKDTVTQAENWKAAAADESIMGKGGLEALTRTAHAAAFGFHAGGGPADHSLHLLQLEQNLEGAGLNGAAVVAKFKGNETLDYATDVIAPVGDPATYAEFLQRNWGIPAARAKHYNRAICDFDFDWTDRSALSGGDVTRRLRSITITPWSPSEVALAKKVFNA